MIKGDPRWAAKVAASRKRNRERGVTREEILASVNSKFTPEQLAEMARKQRGGAA